MDKAVRAGDAAEKALERRMRLIYRAALQTALERQAAFFEMVKDVQEGRKLPHPYYDTPEAIERWKQRFLIELARQQHVIDQIAEELAKAGVKCSSAIKRVLPELYDENREYTLGQTGVARENFAIYDKRQLETILKDEQSPFSKIAYKNLGKKKPIVARLGNELAASIMTGESQEDLLKRIQKVTGQSLMQARRVAQTERVRIQSQARADAITEAAQMGINMAQTWTARHVNTRDAHEFLHGKTIMARQTFEVDAGHDVISRSKKGIRTGGGYEIAFPGDPNAPARAVINCHCVLVPRVLKPGEVLPGMDQQRGEASQILDKYDGASHFDNDKSGLINGAPSGTIGLELERRKKASDGREIIDKATYSKLTRSFLKSGGMIIRGKEADLFLNIRAHASYIVGAKVAYIRDDATVSDVLEEMYHALQDRRHDYGEFPDNIGMIKREIDAQNYLLSVISKNKIPSTETAETKANLAWYEMKLKELEGMEE